MGVPKFFRYTSERYPCLNELVKQYQIPDFDNMYLDMNGIIHNCSHPDDSNPHFRITEEKIFKDIFHYLSMLFQIIKPKKLFFMAIDGVAPRAKMNQQRGRRFRSAREAEQLEEKAKAKGEKLPTEKRFDSNCITPGTVFMARLHEQLRYFIKHKMSTDPLWSKVKVILSGHETPGEGEHKIMDYIRWARSQPNYDPNTRHCLYGLDADLIMLGMCTHEPHFALLREEVKFGRSTQRATSPEETNFYLLHLSLLREYLEQEFIMLKDSLPFPYDIEKIVDDWVLMGFLVGNDFIPNLPNMHISNDALPLLYKTYMTVLPTLNGYINEAGDLNLERFEIFMQELAKIDKEKFQDTYADLKYFEAKTGRRPNANERKEYKPNNDETFDVNIEDIKANKPDDELQALINATHDMMMDDLDDDEEYEETSDEEANIEMEFKLHKKDYYINKLDYSKVTDEVLADQAEGYVRAIQWNLFYYYKGCPSWCWYYPHHYAPYMSDIKGFKDLKIEFELGEPFKPFEQLLAVLPAASKQLLPAPFHDLMTDEDSPIVHYYPIHFETDLNGKRNDWEAVVLIPFIDETNLLSAMAPCYQRLTEEEHRRNTHGPMLVYNWTSQSQGTVQAPEYFPPITDCHAKEAKVWRSELEVPKGQLKRGMLPNAKRNMLFPGFPTMRHLKYKTALKKGKVKVFDLQSKNDNMIVELLYEENESLKATGDSLEKVAHKYLGKIIWVGWPHLTRAKVISVSNEKMRLHHLDQDNNNEDGLPSYSTEPNNGNLHKQWKMEKSTIVEHNLNRLGIELGDVTTIIHAVSLKGFKYLVKGDSKIAQEPEWYTIPCGYAHQAVVKDVSTYILDEPNRFSTAMEAYPPGDHVFLLTQGPHYGCLATVVDSDGIKSGRIRVQVKERPEPTPECAYVSVAPYKSAGHAAAACGISAQMLSRITGTVFVAPGERNNRSTDDLNRINVGLNLKFNKKNLQVSGYTRRCTVTNSWLYSQRCIDLVKSYEEEFPELFDSLAQHLNRDVFFESDLWPNAMGAKKAEDIANWLKSQPHSSASRTECGSEALEPEEMKALANDIDKQMFEIKTREKKVTLQVKWNLLYKPELHEGNIQPDPKADFKIYDRVVSVGRNITAPFGATGTITAIYKPPNANTVRLSDKLNAEPTYQVMFDEPFPGATTEEFFDQPRFYRMLPTNMLNISFGRKLRKNISNAMGEQDSFGYSNNTPNVLRREDGHHSAFACYSPPVDKKSPQIDNRNIIPNTVTSNGQPQDNATHLLRSLLKISETKTDFTEQNKNMPETNQNWRSRNDNNTQISPQRMQQQNWRKENATFNPRPPQQQMYSNEWTNSSYKAVPPPAIPPYPTFGQPFPGTSQMPFPFQNPHFQQRNFFQNNQRPPYVQSQAQAPHIQPLQTQPPQIQTQQPHIQPPQTQPPHPQQPQAQPPNLQPLQAQPPQVQPLQAQPPQSQLQGNFPKHLPSVYAKNISLVPSWVKGPSLQSVANTNQPPIPYPQQNSSDRINNPFVPLQVQTSQRKAQNTSGTSLRRESNDIAAPKAILQKPEPTEPAVTQQQQSTSSKNIKKKKPRIAANLPFQID